MFALRILTALLLVTLACVPQQRAEISPGKAQKSFSYYTKELKPLTVEECGRCHYSVYQSLKSAGGKHSGVLCARCHKQFHVYNPAKNNWSQIMPKCEACHKLPHGPSVTHCGACHVNPHAPKKIPMAAIEKNVGSVIPDRLVR